MGALARFMARGDAASAPGRKLDIHVAKLVRDKAQGHAVAPARNRGRPVRWPSVEAVVELCIGHGGRVDVVGAVAVAAEGFNEVVVTLLVAFFFTLVAVQGAGAARAAFFTDDANWAARRRIQAGQHELKGGHRVGYVLKTVGAEAAVFISAL